MVKSKSRTHGSLIKFRRFIKRHYRGEFRDRNNVCKALKKRAHKMTRIALKQELNNPDGHHKIVCSADDWDLY